MTADAARRPPFEVVAETPSTNALVAERARKGADEGLVIVAEHQTAGRGRLDRTWETPAGSALTFSMLLRPSVPAADWPWLPLLTGYAVARVLTRHGYAADVKWPNDVLINDGKVAGILVERVDSPSGPAAVVGVGLNTEMTADQLPVPTATSLALEFGGPVERDRLLLDLVTGVRESLDEWPTDAYAAACVTIGRLVRVDLPDGSALSGRAVAVDESGRLVVEAEDGRQAVGAGDVVHVRSVASDG